MSYIGHNIIIFYIALLGIDIFSHLSRREGRGVEANPGAQGTSIPFMDARLIISNLCKFPKIDIHICA